jgi:hypothetical protein
MEICGKQKERKIGKQVNVVQEPNRDEMIVSRGIMLQPTEIVKRQKGETKYACAADTRSSHHQVKPSALKEKRKA